jgi:hypothetical protein
MGTKRGSARKYEQFLYNTNNMLLTSLVWREEFAVIRLLLGLYDLKIRNETKKARELVRRQRDEEVVKQRNRQEKKKEENVAQMDVVLTKAQKQKEKRQRKKEQLQQQKEQAIKKVSGFQTQKALFNKMMEKIKKGEEVSSKYIFVFLFILILNFFLHI